ncbi:MAG: class IV adenylate cyclase [Planctomycetia bacterium]|nr:class IV adenylate cyclase [Planctomycetia bacterium]
MATEIEAKVKVEDPEAVRRKADDIGAEGLGAFFESNRIFDARGGTLHRSDSAIRIREETPVGGEGPARVTVTFKGPREAGAMKSRPEWNVEVSGARAAAAMFEALGFSETFYYEKHREKWRAGPCEICLDEAPFLGWFVEVEGPGEKAIRETLENLGLAEKKIIVESYIHLLAEHLAESGTEPSRAAFED